MNQAQLNLAGGAILFVAAVFTAWPRLHFAEAPQQRIDSCSEFGNQSPFSDRPGTIRHRPSAAVSASHNPSSLQPAVLEQIIISSQKTSPASSRPSSQPSRSARMVPPILTYESVSAPSDLILTSGLPAASPLALTEAGAKERVTMSPVIFPAALIQIDHPAIASPQAESHLGEIANNFTNVLGQSGLDPASPEYYQLWNREQAIADARFRAMYGSQAWTAHHIQSHHAISNLHGQ